MIQGARLIQSSSSLLGKAPCILKAIHMELLIYLSLELPMKMTISVFYTIYQSNTCIEVFKLIGSKAETHSVMWKTIYLLLILGFVGKICRPPMLIKWSSALLKPIHHWSDMAVLGIIIKTYTIFGVTIYNFLQNIICQFMTWHTKPLVKHTLYGT